jgi:hypothetical protein
VGLAHRERVAPKIVAIELHEVERVEEDARVVTLVPDALERRDPIGKLTFARVATMPPIGAGIPPNWCRLRRMLSWPSAASAWNKRSPPVPTGRLG